MLFTVSFHGTRLFYSNFTELQPCVHITNRESIFFSRNQVQLKVLNQFVSDGFEILQMTSYSMQLSGLHIIFEKFYILEPGTLNYNW